ncbi:Anti-sigma F factor [Halomicronema hongdechloris C2206]|uniref:Anti-sigma F factor n=1 Tax=Halomicronema hongdechloris C2206 TaxID=1641165 RepID=A0A1Z3HG75_9CYAN|nr:anti-sigma regulatory factor [Halomicronema hongdechloris]ASC69304.1 Anti-sigma F factor [Halomicronema hongdechloris C2206]
MLLQKRDIRTQSDPKALNTVLVWFDQFQELSLPHTIWLQCQLALIEGFTNAVRHAHQGLPENTPIDIEVTISQTTVDIYIWDSGPGFDLMAMLARKLRTTNHDSEGGRGLRIIHLIADQMTYQRMADHRNCLHICKHYQSEA